MTISKKFISVFAAIITVISSIAFSANAKNVCDEISGKSDRDGGVSTTFYVSTADKKKHYVKMDMNKGKLISGSSISCGFTFGGKKIYDYYEVLVFGKKADGSYVQISKANVKNKSSYKINFSGYTNYKIKIWSWRTNTINNSGKYFVNWVTDKPFTDCTWKTVPTWRICKTSGVTLCG